MIVALLGTNPYSFDRLIRPLDELAGKNAWQGFVQLGHTVYEPVNLEYQRFVPKPELMSRIEAADVVVCQGGFGSIRDALRLGKSVVAVPRKPELGESPDEQEEMVRAMEAEGYLIGVYDIGDLEQAIAKARRFRPVPRPASRVPHIIGRFLEENFG